MIRTHGRFISFEGIEGAGKSTVITAVADMLTEQGLDVTVTREPGGTPLAEQLRSIVLARESGEALTPEAELLLVFAARAQHLREVVRPVLESGGAVICDRFTDASYAYQGGGRGLAVQHIDHLANWLHGDLWPDMTLLLDVPEELGLARIARRAQLDRFEQEKAAFFARVREVYRKRAEAEPARFCVIDAREPLARVTEAACTAVRARLGL
ncbi:MAG: dTMP kinase [Pseudomonadota bacterium]